MTTFGVTRHRVHPAMREALPVDIGARLTGIAVLVIASLPVLALGIAYLALQLRY